MSQTILKIADFEAALAKRPSDLEEYAGRAKFSEQPDAMGNTYVELNIHSRGDRRIYFDFKDSKVGCYCNLHRKGQRFPLNRVMYESGEALQEALKKVPADFKQTLSHIVMSRLLREAIA